MKVKFFMSHDLTDLENQINTWLVENNVEVISTHQNAVAGRVQDTTRLMITLSIFYETKELLTREVE